MALPLLIPAGILLIGGLGAGKFFLDSATDTIDELQDLATVLTVAGTVGAAAFLAYTYMQREA